MTHLARSRWLGIGSRKRGPQKLAKGADAHEGPARILSLFAREGFAASGKQAMWGT
jgi:hypothetical protein